MKSALNKKLADPERINQKLINEILDAQNQSIEFIAFSGGGAKGISYSGVYPALIDSGIMKGVKTIAGSSIGSMTAALSSSGISKEDCYNLSLNINLKKLLSDKFTFLYNDGKPLLNIVRKTIQNNIIKYFDKLDIEKIVKHQILLTKNQLNKGYKEELQNKLNKLMQIKENKYKELYDLKDKANSLGGITFKDLDLLQSIDPEKFKGLIIIATQQNNLQLTIFNIENTPDIEIADAVRASCALPLLLTSHEINNIKYIDAGLNDNTPIDYFRNQIRKFTYEKMIIFSFPLLTASISPINSNLPNKMNNKISKFFINLLPQIISKQVIDEINTYNELQKYPLESIILDVNNISSLSFDQAQEQLVYLYNKAYLQTTEYLENHNFIKEKDQNLGIKNLILNLYKEISQPSWLESILSYICTTKSKYAFLLNFIKEEYVKTQSDKVLISKFIKTICKKNQDGSLDFNNPLMKKLINLLNKSDIESNVKSQFISFLKIPFDTDPEQINKEIFQFKFDQKSFEEYFDQANIGGIIDIHIEE